MAIRNVEVRRKGEGFSILEQAGSDQHKERVVHEASSRTDAEAWLKEQGGEPESIRKALNDAGTDSPVFIELGGNWSEAESFPKR